MRLLGGKPISDDELVATIRRPVSSTDDAVALTEFAGRFAPVAEDLILEENRAWISPERLGRATGLAIDLTIERVRNGKFIPGVPLREQVADAARAVSAELRRTRRLPSLQDLLKSSA